MTTSETLESWLASKKARTSDPTAEAAAAARVGLMSGAAAAAERSTTMTRERMTPRRTFRSCGEGSSEAAFDPEAAAAGAEAEAREAGAPALLAAPRGISIPLSSSCSASQVRSSSYSAR